MTWNWQLKNWPNYTDKLQEKEVLEHALSKASGVFLGVYKCLDADEQEQIKIELLSEEALNTSAIEGEVLNRDSLQASLKRVFGLSAEKRHSTPAEKGIAQMMLQVYRDYSDPLSAETLFTWHKLLMSGHS
jgi:Fic family protein